MTQIIEQTMPHDLHAERSVLGSLFIQNHLVALVRTKIKPNDFYRRAHRDIYTAIVRLYDRDTDIDGVTLSNQLRDSGTYESVGGEKYLMQVVSSVPHTQHVDHHCDIVRRYAVQRAIIRTAHDIMMRSYGDTGDDFESFLDEIHQNIADATSYQTTNEISPDEIIDNIIKELEEPDEPSLVTFPWLQIQRHLRGLISTDIALISGKTGSGKTSFALNLAKHNLQQGKKVIFFSLEVEPKDIYSRLACIQAHDDGLSLGIADFIEKGCKDTREQKKRLYDAIRPLCKNLILPAVKNLTVHHVEQYIQLHNPDIVFIDYVQLIRDRQRNKNMTRQQELGQTSRDLKLLANKYKCPLILLAQLNDEGRIREARDFENDCSVFIKLQNLFNDSYNEPDRGKVKVIIDKGRIQGSGKTQLHFNGSQCVFTDEIEYAKPIKKQKKNIFGVLEEVPF